MAHQGIETWNAGISVIFSEELAIDEHFQVFVFLFEIDGDPGRKGNSKEQDEGESKVERAHGVRDRSEAGRSVGGKKECRLLRGSIRANVGV